MILEEGVFFLIGIKASYQLYRFDNRYILLGEKVELVQGIYGETCLSFRFILDFWSVYFEVD